MGQAEKLDCNQRCKKAEKEDERRWESQTFGYGKSQMEESESRGQGDALSSKRRGRASEPSKHRLLAWTSFTGRFPRNYLD